MKIDIKTDPGQTLDIMVDGVAWGPAAFVEPDPEPEPVKFNAAAFFDYIRGNLFWGSLSQEQVDGFNALAPYLAKAFPESDPVRIQNMAYCLATFQWETASTMKPIAEYGGKSARYAPWYGRGYVQLTWEENYLKQEKKLGKMPVDPNNPYPWQVHENRELALHPDTSAVISIYGMIDGDFTAFCMGDFITPDKIDYVGCRQVVNGTDSDDEIADMARKYEEALRLGFSG